MNNIKYYDEIQIPAVDVFHLSALSRYYKYFVLNITLGDNQFSFLVRNNTIFLCIINREYLHIYADCIFDNSLYNYLDKYLNVNTKFNNIDKFELYKYARHTIKLQDLINK